MTAPDRGPRRPRAVNLPGRPHSAGSLKRRWNGLSPRSGPGSPAAEIDRIFGRFTRTGAGRSRETGGFGPGLAVVKAIAEAHGGSVHVRSTMGHGSVFELLLPATAARTSARRAHDPQRTPE